VQCCAAAWQCRRMRRGKWKTATHLPVMSPCGLEGGIAKDPFLATTLQPGEIDKFETENPELLGVANDIVRVAMLDG